MIWPKAMTVSTVTVQFLSDTGIPVMIKCLILTSGSALWCHYFIVTNMTIYVNKKVYLFIFWGKLSQICSHIEHSDDKTLEDYK